jgi:hypothetical protein
MAGADACRHENYLQRPFLEAQAATHRRLHEMGLPH